MRCVATRNKGKDSMAQRESVEKGTALEAKGNKWMVVDDACRKSVTTAGAAWLGELPATSALNILPQRPGVGVLTAGGVVYQHGASNLPNIWRQVR